jgi:serine/threonine-protein kinase RsbW
MQPASSSDSPTPTSSRAELFALRVPNDVRSIRLVLGALTAALDTLGFATDDANKLRLAVDEACTNVLKHAYRPDESATYDVECSIEFGKLKVRVKDNGLPYDPFHTPHYDPAHPGGKGLGMYLMEQLAHEVRYVNLGREGKAFDILYTLPGGWEQHPQPLAGAGEEQAAPDPESLGVRLFHPDDAGQVARCAYSVYGYSYFGEHLYIPEQLIAMNQRGDLVSAVLADKSGRVFGHLALVFGPDRVIPEEGQAFVMPSVRGGGWFKKMKAFLYDIAAQRGLPGVFSDGVTVHPFTQKANLSMGSRPCGILLAFAPGTVQFKQISQADSYRHSLVVFYKPLQVHPVGRGYLPARHADMIRAIYANLEIPFEELPSAAPLSEGPSVIDTVNNQFRGIAYLTVVKSGSDLVDQLKKKVHQLCARGTAVIQLDMPLSDPVAAHFTEAIEALGFFFIGVVPKYFGASPSVRFEYLNNVEVHTETIVLEGDFSKRLLEYILKQVPP